MNAEETVATVKRETVSALLDTQDFLVNKPASLGNLVLTAPYPAIATMALGVIPSEGGACAMEVGLDRPVKKKSVEFLTEAT